MDSTKTTTEIEILKQKLRATWTAGDFGEIAKSFESGAEDFVTRLGITKGISVLDVACGNGNTAIPAAWLGAEVTGVDIAPYLIEQAIVRAERAGVKAEFDVGDAEALPYEDASFDLVISMYGAMFAPRPEVAAAEMKRVCVPGGKIAMANWTPQSVIGQIFRATAKHLPPASGAIAPGLWGDEDTVRERLAEGVTDLQMRRTSMDFVFPFSPAEVVEHFRKFYGPTQKAFDALDSEDRKEALRADLVEVWSSSNEATDGTTKVPVEYLEVTAIKA